MITCRTVWSYLRGMQMVWPYRKYPYGCLYASPYLVLVVTGAHLDSTTIVLPLHREPELVPVIVFARFHQRFQVAYSRPGPELASALKAALFATTG